MRVLITCGPTWVPIDDVRVLSNTSSGEMGHLIAQSFIAHGAKVTLLEGQVTHLWHGKSVKVVKFRFFDELEKILKCELKKKYDCVVHAAAVSDFKLKEKFQGKMKSDVGKASSLSLQLVPTEKIINQIKNINPRVVLVGFKLEPDLRGKRLMLETRKLFENAHCDVVVANSLEGGYKGFVVDAKGNVLAQALNKKVLAKSLVKLLI